MVTELNAIITIAYRDFTKFLRDRPRILISFVLPTMFVGILGGSLQANLAKNVGFNFLAFVFVGVLAQVLFQSTASGIISLVEDREQDFSQAIFVAPVRRSSIIIGKILGEGSVSFCQAAGVIIFGLIMGVPLSFWQFARLLPAAAAVSFLGGAFGMLVLANLGNQQRVRQIFPLVIFPQFFLAGVFNPITHLPPVLFVLSRIAPLTYGVDFLRGIYYAGMPEASTLVLHSPLVNLGIITVLSGVFLAIGTALFVRSERNR